MADSDSDYALSDNDKEVGVSSRKHSTRRNKQAKGAAPQKEKWEEIQRSWDNVVEGEDGSLASTVYNLLESNKRKRLLRDTTPLQRGIIRHLVLLIDLSVAMGEKDFRPTRYILTLRYLAEVVREFFEQNPISQMSIIGMRDGLAVTLSDMSGDVNSHIDAIRKLRLDEPKGDPSLQNGLEMSRGVLYGVPKHATREILIIFGALHTVDPGDIHATVNSCVADGITVRVVGLAAQMAICREVVKRTNGGDDSGYGVALDEVHYKELVMGICIPPAQRKSGREVPSLLLMGFPSRDPGGTESICACHGKLTRAGYKCPRCQAKICSLPMSCPACATTLILSTHLARSYHHLFPLQNWTEVPLSQARRSSAPRRCFACQSPFTDLPPRPPTTAIPTGNAAKPPPKAGANEPVQPPATASGRYACPSCEHWFCLDCDIFAHEEVYCCAGCEGDPGAVVRVRERKRRERKEAKAKEREKEKEKEGGGEANGVDGVNGHGGGTGNSGEPMVLD